MHSYRQESHQIFAVGETVPQYLCKSSHYSLNLLLASCFTEAGFTPALRPEPEPSSPQADTAELAAYVARFLA
ncbi:MAG: hypothetical protein K6346_08790, partial [Halothiobacillaceae bacterium]